jgi:uncharacterized protein (TIGR02145 family)
LRSTYTWQGNIKQEIAEDKNVKNDNNAVSYYYPYAQQTTFNNQLEYGLLYTWGAANIGAATTEAVNAFPNKPSDRQGICPDGWVIPSDYDWIQLEKEIATNPGLYSSQTTSTTWDVSYESLTGWRPGELNPTGTWWGRSMKSPTKVVSTTTTIAATNGVSKEDGTGFNALLVGTLYSGSADSYGTSAHFWSGSADSATDAWRRILNNGYSGVYRTSRSKCILLSVRCKK